MAMIEPSNQTLIKMIEEIKVTLLTTMRPTRIKTREKKKKVFDEYPLYN